jgi:hypothetical protein
VIHITSSGSFSNFERFAAAILRRDHLSGLESYAQRGVDALAKATPVDTGKAAGAWTYTIKRDNGGASISWTNTDIEDGFPVVIKLDVGYGTGTGGYVRGRKFISPAIQPIMDQIANEVWEKVRHA